MFGKRSDGRQVHEVEPFQRIIPYIMRTRTDSMNMFEESIPCAGMDGYVSERRAKGDQITYLHVVVAALVRLVALRPQLNRFVVRGRIYTRPKIWVSFVVHQSLRTDDAGTTIKLCFEGTESILEISERINAAILKETAQKTESNSTDKLAGLIMSIPGPLIRFVVNTLIFMDRHNILPKAVIEASPFHTSLFVTNLRSLGINHIFHHVYEFGTTGVFVCMGKPVPNFLTGEYNKKIMPLGIVMDERICTGHEYALFWQTLRRYLKHPELTENGAEERAEMPEAVEA